MLIKMRFFAYLENKIFLRCILGEGEGRGWCLKGRQGLHWAGRKDGKGTRRIRGWWKDEKRWRRMRHLAHGFRHPIPEAGGY